MAEASAAVLALVPNGRMVAYGHVGDGNLHFNVSVPIGGDAEQFLAHAPAIHAAVHAIVAAIPGQHQRRARHRPPQARGRSRASRAPWTST